MAHTARVVPAARNVYFKVCAVGILLQRLCGIETLLCTKKLYKAKSAAIKVTALSENISLSMSMGCNQDFHTWQNGQIQQPRRLKQANKICILTMLITSVEAFAQGKHRACHLCVTPCILQADTHFPVNAHSKDLGTSAQGGGNGHNFFDFRNL